MITMQQFTAAHAERVILANKCDIDLLDAAGRKFDEISERIGSDLRINQFT